MAFLETPRFPDAISYGAVGGPAYQTDVVVVASGQETRNRAWSQARLAWDVGHAARNPTEYAALLAFFRIAAGRANGFRFKDWSDFQVSSGQGVLVELTATTFQLYKRYTSGSSTEDRLISKPIASTVAITGGGTYSLNAATGVVTVSAGADPTGWTGEFDVPCRFDADAMRGEILSRSGSNLVMGWSSIPVLEIRP